MFGTVSALPMILTTPTGCIVADRVNKKKVIVALMLLFAIDGLMTPAVQSSVPSVVPGNKLVLARDLKMLITMPTPAKAEKGQSPLAIVKQDLVVGFRYVTCENPVLSIGLPVIVLTSLNLGEDMFGITQGAMFVATLFTIVVLSKTIFFEHKHTSSMYKKERL